MKRRLAVLAATAQRLVNAGMTPKQAQLAVLNANFIYCPHILINPG
jgi:hypothetical protein